MRIGMLFSSPLPPSDGIGAYVWNLACFLRDRGHQVHLITRGGFRSIPVQRLDDLIIHRPAFWPLYPFQMRFHALFVSQLLRRLRPALDLLHLHWPESPIPETDLPLLATVHAPLVSRAASNGSSALKISAALIRQADRVTAVSARVVDQLKVSGLAKQEIPVMANGVFTDFFVPPPPRVLLPEKPIFVTVGSLAAHKGLGDFIAACARVHFVYPNVRFMIIGSGPLEAELRAEITRAKLDGVVRLVGAVTDRMTLSIFYQNAYAYVHPSPHNALPTSLLEAMSCGKAVVAVENPEVQQVVRDDENGLLIPARRPDEMARAMLRLVEAPGLVNNLGQAARGTIETNYSWETIGARYLAEYQNLVGRKM